MSSANQTAAGDGDFSGLLGRLSFAFLLRLAGEIGMERLAEVFRRNAAEVNPSVCHSHDFCDANVLMADAFACVVGRRVDIESDEDASLWNGAWFLAKSRMGKYVKHDGASLSERPSDQTQKG